MMRSVKPKPLRVALLGMLIAAVVIGWGLIGSGRWDPVTPGYAFDASGHPMTGIDRLLGASDGVSYVRMARDPVLTNPSPFSSSPEMAYRWQRPAWAWAAWALSLGRPGAVPWALALLAIIGAGLAAGALGRLFGYRALWAFAFPPVLTVVEHLLPEVAGLGLVVLGVSWWGEGRRGWAIGAFTVAGLLREELLIVPAALLVWSLCRHVPWRTVKGLAVPVAAWTSWMAIIVVRVGTLPNTNDQIARNGGRLALPLTGVTPASWGVLGWLTAAAVLVLPVVAVVRRRDMWSAIAGSYACFGLIMGRAVWANWLNFSRPLLPAVIFAAVSLGNGSARWSSSRSVSPVELVGGLERVDGRDQPSADPATTSRLTAARRPVSR